MGSANGVQAAMAKGLTVWSSYWVLSFSRLMFAFPGREIYSSNRSFFSAYKQGSVQYGLRLFGHLHQEKEDNRRMLSEITGDRHGSYRTNRQEGALNG